jgi:hypothetical protein
MGVPQFDRFILTDFRHASDPQKSRTVKAAAALWIGFRKSYLAAGAEAGASDFFTAGLQVLCLLVCFLWCFLAALGFTVLEDSALAGVAGEVLTAASC